MDLNDLHMKYIKHTLVPLIVQQNECFAGQELVEAHISSVQGLVGFMSFIYQLELKTRASDNISTTKIIIKLMKGDEQFRVGTKSYTQFANEIYFYTKIQPLFVELLAGTGCQITFDDITPTVYYGYFGKVPELGDLPESVLAVQDLRPQNFRPGPRLILDEEHLRLMIGQIAKFHAFSYGLKIKNPNLYTQIVNGIIEMPFTPSGLEGDTTNQYIVVYKIALDRFSAYIERTKDIRSAKFLRDVDNLKQRCGTQPVLLLDHLRRDDGMFSVVQHGDYNRNNVLFRYADGNATFDNPVDIRMIDFQELRFGSPAFDLTFFMYMSCDPTSRAVLWDKLLVYYHQTMVTSLASILGCSSDDDILKPYSSYDEFSRHFAQFAFYGVMVCMQFAPCMMSSEADCDRMSKLFDENMYGREFYDLAMVVAGDMADERITGIVEHASEMGYMKWLEEDDSNECN